MRAYKWKESPLTHEAEGLGAQCGAMAANKGGSRQANSCAARIVFESNESEQTMFRSVSCSVKEFERARYRAWSRAAWIEPEGEVDSQAQLP
jgi:hypothetical protein